MSESICRRFMYPARVRRNCLIPVAIAFALASQSVEAAFLTGWGANDTAQLEPPWSATNAVAVSAGAAHAVALLATGEAVAWGDNTFGQAAIPAGVGSFVSVAAGFRHSLGLRVDGSIVAWGDDTTDQASPPAGTNYTAISAGGAHSLALRQNGTVAAWGANNYGQTNVPFLLGSVRAIAAGGYHSLAVQSNGVVVAWGYNGDGQTSIPSSASNVIAIAAGFRHSLALRNDGTVVAWGSNSHGQRNVPGNLTNVVAVAAGQSQSLALRNDGTLVSWGAAVGGLGLPESIGQIQSVSAGGDFALALVSSPAVLRQPVDALMIPGQPVTLSAVVFSSESAVFQWEKDGTDLLAQTNVSLRIANPAQDDFGEYRLRIQDGGVVVLSQKARLMVPPIIMTQPFSARAFFGSTNFFQVVARGSAPLTYQWYFGTSQIAGGTNSILAFPRAGYTNGGNYFVIVSNAVGAVTSAPVMLEVYPAPALSLWCSASSVESGASVTIGASTYPDVPSPVQWQFNGMDIPGETNITLLLPNARPSNNGSYRYRTTVVGGPAYSSGLTLTVAGTTLTSYVGRRVILDVGQGCGLARSFRWFRDGTELAGATNSMIRLETLALGDAGKYTAKVGFDGGERVFTVADLTVLAAPAGPAIIDHPVGGDRDVGQSFELKAGVWSSEPVTWQWRRNGTNIVGAQASSLVLTNLQLGDAGQYSVVVKSTGGTVISDPARLNVYRPPFLPPFATRGGVVLWGGIPQSLGTSVPAGLGEVAGISAGVLSYGESFAIDPEGVTIWNTMKTNRLNAPNLLSVLVWRDYFLGLRANGVVAAWDKVSLAPTNPPAGLTDIVQLAGNGSYLYVAVREDGTVRHSGPGDFFPASLSNVIQAACGEYHAVALRRDGTVVRSGLLGTSAQTEVPAGLSNVVQVAAGAQHTLALTSAGTVVAWGRTNEGQCFVPGGLTNVTAVAAGANFSMALRADGTVVVWGDNSQGQTMLPPGLTNVVAIAAGNIHCLALRQGPVRVSGPDDLILPPGQSGKFEIVAQGDPLSYQWYFSGETIAGATNSALQVTAGPETEGLYSVTAWNSKGSFTESAMLWQGVPPQILVEPDGGVVATSGSWTFMVLASGDGPLWYQWQANGTNIANATNASYRITNATARHSGLYVANVVNSFGMTSSRPVRLTVMSPPVIMEHPGSVTLAEGETVSFAASVEGDRPLSFQWYFGEKALPDQTNAFLEILGITKSHSGSYWVMASNGAGTTASQPAILTVADAAPAITQAPADRAARFGEDVSFTATAIGAAPLRYQWWHDGRPVEGANSSILNLTRVDRADEGDYNVVVSNAAGSVTSAPPAHLAITISPNVVVWGTNALASAIPPDLTNATVVSASSHVLALRSDGTVTAWGLNDNAQASVPVGLSNVIAIAVGSRHSLALKSDGRVVAWGADTNGTGYTNVPADLTNAIAIAAGSLHSLALRANGTVAAWGYNVYGQATPPVGLSNVVGLTANGEVSVAVKADGTISRWGSGYRGGDSLTNIVGVMGRGKMLALRGDRRILGWDSYSRAAVEGPSGVANADSYNVSYTQGNTTYIETHEIGLVTNGTIAVWGGNRGGIFNASSLSNVLSVAAGSFFNVAVVGGPTLLRHPASLTLAAGEAGTLNVEAVGHTPLRYQWRFNGQDLAEETNASLTISSVTPARTGDYAVLVSDSTGAVLSRTATVLVVTSAPYVLRQPQSLSAVEGTNVSFSVEAVGLEPRRYQWFHNGSLIPGATEQVLALNSTSASDAGLYNTVVSNAWGVAISSNAVLTLTLPDLIVDNSDAVVRGPWLSNSNSAQIGTNFLFIRSGFGANEVRFVPNLPRAGLYQVSTRTQWGDPFMPGLLIVHHSNGTSAVSPANTSGWLRLGTYSFEGGTSGAVIVSDDFASGSGLAVADAIQFRYVLSPPVITRHPLDLQVVEGMDAVVSLTATGALPLMCQWQFNGVNLPEAVGQTLRLSAVNRAQAGRYRALLSNTDGSVFSREITLKVVAQPLRGSLQNGKLILDWNATARLETATNVAGPFIELQNAQPPLLVEPTDGRRFFRLAQ